MYVYALVYIVIFAVLDKILIIEKLENVNYLHGSLYHRRAVEAVKCDM